MRFWFDTEFIEDGRTIDLVSIGIVSQDDREYYAVSSEFDASKAVPWVKENVLSQIDQSKGKPRKQIRHELQRFIGHYEYDQLMGTRKGPEIWAYYGAYDWVALCQLFGPMVDLPQGWPMYVRDVKQWCDELGNPQLPSQGKNLHHSLYDARWTKKAWEFLRPRIEARDAVLSAALGWRRLLHNDGQAMNAQDFLDRGETADKALREALDKYRLSLQ
jgi:hypothetical protein